MWKSCVLLRLGTHAKYCDQHACLFVCLSERSHLSQNCSCHRGTVQQTTLIKILSTTAQLYEILGLYLKGVAVGE